LIAIRPSTNRVGGRGEGVVPGKRDGPISPLPSGAREGITRKLRKRVGDSFHEGLSYMEKKGWAPAVVDNKVDGGSPYNGGGGGLEGEEPQTIIFSKGFRFISEKRKKGIVPGINWMGNPEWGNRWKLGGYLSPKTKGRNSKTEQEPMNTTSEEKLEKYTKRTGTGRRREGISRNLDRASGPRLGCRCQGIA